MSYPAPAKTDLDTKTYRAVRAELASGAQVSRDFRTGAVVPAHLKGKLYGAGDLHASAFAEIDAEMAAWRAEAAAKREARAAALLMAAE